MVTTYCKSNHGLFQVMGLGKVEHVWHEFPLKSIPMPSGKKSYEYKFDESRNYLPKNFKHCGKELFLPQS